MIHALGVFMETEEALDEEDPLEELENHFDEGMEAFRNNEVEKASKRFKKGLSILKDVEDIDKESEKRFALNYQRGRALRKAGKRREEKGDVGKAKKHYEKAVESFEGAQKNDENAPDQLKGAALFSWKGEVLHKLGRFDEALKAFDNAIEEDEKSFGPHLKKGKALREMGRDEQALEEFNKALEFCSTLDQRIAREKVSTLTDLERYEDALATIGRVKGVFGKDRVVSDLKNLKEEIKKKKREKKMREGVEDEKDEGF